MVARVTRVSASQNIHVQPSRDLRLENFPSLSITTPFNSEETSALKTGWVKKDLNKDIKNAPVKNVPRGKNPPPVEEYPVLAPSSLYEPCETGVWISSKTKSMNSVGNNIPSVTPNTESYSEQQKIRSKKKKTSSKLPNKNKVPETNMFSGETKNKVSKMQVSELKHQTGEIPKTIQIGKTKVDLNSEANTFESKNCASKITIINPQSNLKPIENSGAKPKTKGKPINLSEFPALSSSGSTLSSFFDDSQQNTSQMTRVEKLAPTKVSTLSFINNSSGQNFPLTLNNNSNRAFLQPPDFNVRNQQLISTVMDLLCNQRKKIEKFRTISSQFRGGQLDSKEYYMVVNFIYIFT